MSDLVFLFFKEVLHFYAGINFKEKLYFYAEMNFKEKLYLYAGMNFKEKFYFYAGMNFKEDVLFSDAKWIFKISFFSCRRCPKDNVKFQLRIRCIISYNRHVCAFITLAFIVFLYTLYDQGENNRGIENVKTECTSVRERKKIGGLQ